MSWLPVVTIHGTDLRHRLVLLEEQVPERAGRSRPTSCPGRWCRRSRCRPRAGGRRGSGAGSAGRWRAAAVADALVAEGGEDEASPGPPGAVRKEPMVERCARVTPGRSPRGRRRSSTSCRGAGRPAPRAGSTAPAPSARPSTARGVQVAHLGLDLAAQLAGLRARPGRTASAPRAAPARRSASASSGRRRRRDGGRRGRPREPWTCPRRGGGAASAACVDGRRAAARTPSAARPRHRARRHQRAAPGQLRAQVLVLLGHAHPARELRRDADVGECPWRGSSQRMPTPAIHTGERGATG